MIREMYNLLGWRRLEELAARLGGKRIYMSSNGQPPDRLIKILGDHTAEEIRCRWAGMRIEIPRFESVANARINMQRRDRAAALLAEGLSVRAIASKTGLSERTIRRLR